MRDDQRSSIYHYLDRYVSSCELTYTDEASFSDPSWETLMALLNCIEANYFQVGFDFDRNRFRIEYNEDGERKAVQNKGSNLKEAMVLCCFKLLSESDETAPQLNLPNDLFLVDEDES